MKQNINPDFQKKQTHRFSVSEAVEGIRNRDTLILGQLISRAESHLHEDQMYLLEVLQSVNSKNQSRTVAVSGAPGVGKSSFINAIGQTILEEGQSIAVLPVDPTSRVSQGSILGDKTRMYDIVKDENCFIKPMSSSLSLGGVAPATHLATLICQKAGYDYIFIETVGVGQSEFKVRFMVDCFLLLLQPGSGDDLQGIKRGIMEMADIFIVNKADGELESAAQKSLQICRNAIKLMLPNEWNWKADVRLFSSLSPNGSSEIISLIGEYYEFLSVNDKLEKMRRSNQQIVFAEFARDLALNYIMAKEATRQKFESLNEKLKREDLSFPEALIMWKDYLKNEI